MRLTIASLSIIAIFALGIKSIFFFDSGDLRVVIEDASRDTTFYYYIDKNDMPWPNWGIDVEENTMDDTAYIGIVPIPPRFEGRLFNVEWGGRGDSTPIHFKHRKVQKGKITIICWSTP